MRSSSLSERAPLRWPAQAAALLGACACPSWLAGWCCRKPGSMAEQPWHAGGLHPEGLELFNSVKGLTRHYVRTMDPTWLRDSTRMARQGAV